MKRPTKDEVEAALGYASQIDMNGTLVGPFDASMSALADEVLALREEYAQLKAKYKRDLSNHSCNSGGGPDMCGGCCECLERQFGGV